ncbi:DUF1700 domain-containing protein [Clostridium sp. ATCC 25772]|uniref:DUF1700 domain-containing protein n=1 Tax=Clostridium sp. ATCC 25772 TaxID=1676991 RepID=UPI00078672EA|nr:DUF1700 domain-containing protein [Clostridium sp. ATCC 25772]
MNRKEFLEILRDYLSDSFSENEVSDIIRDYEEFFLNGELEGKSDETIISSLGSPKTIANDLKREMKKSDVNSNQKKDYGREAKKIWGKTKRLGKRGIERSKEFLNSNDILNEKIPIWGVKAILIILTLFLIMPTIFIITGIISATLTLIGFTIMDIGGYIISFPMMTANMYMGLFIFFMALAGTGVMLALWTIYIYIVKFFKDIILRYISWVKTRKMYIRVKENNTYNESYNNNTLSLSKNEEVEHEIDDEDKEDSYNE